MKGNVAAISKEKLLSMEDGYDHYRHQKPGICVTLLQVLKIILYVELVLFFGFLFTAILYSMPRHYYYEDESTYELDDIYNANDTERPVICEVIKTDTATQKVSEVSDILLREETISENELAELKSSEIQNETNDSEYHYLRLGPIVFRWSKSESDESFSIERSDDGESEVDEVKNNVETEAITDSAKNLIVNCDECNKQGNEGEEKIQVLTSKDQITEMEEQATTPNLEEVIKDKSTSENEHERIVKTVIDQFTPIHDFFMPREYGNIEYDRPMFESRNYNDDYYYDD